MGVDFKGAGVKWENAARWSYSGFHAFREKLARRAGVDDLRKWWRNGSPRDANDPVFDLLDHSDCDGHLTAAQCMAIAPRLRILVSAWAEDDYDRIMAHRLANHMDACAKAGVRLEFC